MDNNPLLDVPPDDGPIAGGGARRPGVIPPPFGVHFKAEGEYIPLPGAVKARDKLKARDKTASLPQGPLSRGSSKAGFHESAHATGESGTDFIPVPPDSGAQNQSGSNIFSDEAQSSATNVPTSKYILSFLLYTLPREIYLYFLLTLPSLYVSRVDEIFREVEQSKPVIEDKLANDVKSTMYCPRSVRPWAADSDDIARLVESWGHFIHSLVTEWETLNIVSVLLSAAILTTLQIDGVATDPYARYFALVALVCSLMSVLYGCLSFIFYLICVMTFVWRTGTTSDTVLQITPLVALGPRIIVTFTLGIGLIYLSLVIREFRHYGNAMGEKWKGKWKKQPQNDPESPRGTSDWLYKIRTPYSPVAGNGSLPAEWLVPAAKEAKRKHSPRLGELQLERTHSQDVLHPHTPGYEEPSPSPQKGPPSRSPTISDSPLDNSGWLYSRHGRSPYSLSNTPAASRGLPMPGGPGAHEPVLDQPIDPNLYFNIVAGNGSLPAEWPVDAAQERTMKHSPRLGELQLERTYSQDVPHPHTLGYENAFDERPLNRSLSAEPMGRPRSQSQSRADYPEHDSENLGRRPEDWRPDYEARRSPILRNQRTDVEGNRPLYTVSPERQFISYTLSEFKDPIYRTIHGTLAYNPADPCVFYDLRFVPTTPILTFPHLERPYNDIDFAQLATNPPVNKMRLFHPLLPWYIDIEQHQENGVTVQDVIMQIHIELQTQIYGRDYFNEEMGSSGRERIARAFERRTQGPEGEEERKKGIRRVDYLEDRVVFVGLVRARDGLWEMKMKAVP
ncbi:hypothetical protein C0995_013285 [Termitomyces sp. Mi166|nr:hypothetical protein C0995_013285 [Termitomyces sp. Mi166\